jgi:hypothetical protein
MLGLLGGLSLVNLKIGVSTRAGAAMVAMQHGLLDQIG